jgi:hypothetical protein
MTEEHDHPPIVHDALEADDAAEKHRIAMIEKARNWYQSDDIEIDDDAKLSEAKEEGGTWVQAWVRVNFDEDDRSVAAVAPQGMTLI